MQGRHLWWGVFAWGLLSCGQTADVIGPRNHEPVDPIVQDTGWITDFEACATVREEAQLLPTSLFLAVDRSCSMDEPADGSTTGPISKWDAATTAFTTFFTDPSSSSLDVALRLWPDATDGCNDTDCDPVACSRPQVTLGAVSDPTHQQALIDAFEQTVPEGATPMSAALDGATRWARARQATAPDDLVSIVLITDGEPNGCDEDPATISAFAASAAADGIPVYAVGIEGSNVALMDQIAVAGDTTASYFVGSKNAEAELLAVLEAIQADVVSCAFAFPTESSGDPLQPDLVRLETTVDGEIEGVARVADAAACAANGGGYYLDDPDMPTQIVLCPSTCSELQALLSITIEIAVGCECFADEDCPGDHLCSENGCRPPCDTPGCPGFEAVGDVLDLEGAQAVQGGALRCATSPASAGWLVTLAALFWVRRRWEGR